MQCPNCFQAELVAQTKDLPYRYKGKETIIPNVSAQFCPNCSEMVANSRESERIMAEMLAFNKKVNSEFADPHYIQQVRKKLNLDQRQAGELFGGGVNAFSRYETGKSQPPVALIKLLKLLDKHPNLLAEVS
ncbi:antitoxin [Haemophilus paracuniculus]|uniref:Antitoxin n=1 Tax=Haemophilus paracuniculus TaxID=734 RepID=A0A1T0ATD8_9PAST|nr:type II TA system antitoxin MqsA family protein [Haemophilus paracuniculus]OOR99728.1 antitoxin [Haemophilus paracuniculus]